VGMAWRSQFEITNLSAECERRRVTEIGLQSPNDAGLAILGTGVTIGVLH